SDDGVTTSFQRSQDSRPHAQSTKIYSRFLQLLSNLLLFFMFMDGEMITLSLPKLKFEKDHMCSACAIGKRKKQLLKPKYEDTNQEKLYLLHMDLCGPMRVASINGKKYILVIVDDYSRFTWVKFLASKDKALDFIIKFLKMIQVRLNTLVRNIRTDNGTQKHDLSYLYVFGALCYPNNDSEDSGKLQAKADIGIFIGYAPKKKSYLIYNRRTRKIIETVHVDFDELTTVAFEQLSLRPELQSMTLATSSSGLITNPIPQQPYIPSPRDDWDRLFQPMFDEYFNPPTIAVSPVPVAATPRTVDLADSPVSTSIDQDAPSTNSTSKESSSNMRPINTPFESLGRWTKDHPIENLIQRSSHGKKEMTYYWYKFSVDDIIFASTNTAMCNEFANLMTTKFKIDSVDIPMVEKNKLDEDLQGTPADATLYRGMIGFAKPTEKHLHAVKWIFRYLKGTITWVSGTRRILWNSTLFGRNINWLTSLPNPCQEKDLFLDREARFLYTATTKVQLLYAVTMFNTQEQSTSIERFNFLIEKLGMRSMSPEIIKCLTEEEDE
nr:integrase, catalytic region, zinc finger, CCHC-type, peptidase aspartic, catalytic [Tanacetum cinerariifolium]